MHSFVRIKIIKDSKLDFKPGSVLWVDKTVASDLIKEGIAISNPENVKDYSTRS